MNNNTPDCTERCHSTTHGNQITAAITKRSITDHNLCSYLHHICTNCESVKDSNGRTALHMAASTGRLDLLRWLIQNRHANINAKDEESGYTPLHRSLFYGQIACTVELFRLGATPQQFDSDCLNPIEHCMKDAIKPDYSLIDGDMYVWGSNTNNLLGPQTAKAAPELLDVFHKLYPSESVHQVCIDQFHSVIVASSGRVYSCGHGQGGRLGLGVEQSIVTPKLVGFPLVNKQGEVFSCVQACISRDHSLFLSSNEIVYACGFNKYFVLGIAPPPQQLLVPKPLKQFSQKLSGICAGRFHSVAWGPNCLYTWGLNAGQLGHAKGEISGFVAPKSVQLLNLGETSLVAVAASDGATAACTKKGDIYVLHEYQCRKIASRQLNVVQMSIIGGKLDPNQDEISRELKVAVLTNTGNLFLWQESDPQLCRCIFSINRAIIIKQIAINLNEILFVTLDGEAFQGYAKARKNKKTLSSEKNNNLKNPLHKFLERDDCILVKLNKIAKVHRALAISSDNKGRDYCVIQAFPYRPYDFIQTEKSEMKSHFEALLSEAHENDDIHDVTIQVSKRNFAAHKYLLAIKSPVLEKEFQNSDFVVLDEVEPAIFEQFLRFAYTNSCDLLKIGELKNGKLRQLCEKAEIDDENNLKVGRNPVRMLQHLAKKLACKELHSALSNFDMHKFEVRCKSGLVAEKVLRFDRNRLEEFQDVQIRCIDGKELRAHRCILSARLEYFNNMFSMRWSGKATSDLTLPFPRSISEALLEFLYSDTLAYLENKEVDHLFKVLMLADQLLVTKLKEQCELLLTNLITLKNAVQLLAFCYIYNADKLKQCCMKFIVANLAALLELRLLDELDDDILRDLSQVYFEEKQAICCRVITPYSTAVSDEEILAISASNPVDLNLLEKQTTPRSAQKRRSHRRSERTLSINNDSLDNDNIIQFPDIPEVDIESTQPKSITNRIKSICLAQEKLRDEIEEPQFTLLAFPELNSPTSPSSGGTWIKGTSFKNEMRRIPKLSQKQRLKSESNSLKESPPAKNPWKTLPPVSLSPSATGSSTSFEVERKFNMSDIIFDEKKQKENLVKLTTKLLIYTQIEDKAILELHKFYNTEEESDEVITIERVATGAVALPIWVPR